MIKKTILITGSCGRIGSSIANMLFKKNYQNILVLLRIEIPFKIQMKNGLILVKII